MSKGVIRVEGKKRIDVLTYAAMAVTLVCVTLTGLMQAKLNNSIKELSSALTAQDEMTSKSNLFALNMPSDEPSSSLAVSETETTLLTEVFTTESNNKTQKHNIEENTTAYRITTTAKLSVEELPMDSVLVYSKNSKKLHSRSCSYAKRINPENLMSIDSADIQELFDNGYTLCSHCKGRISGE